MSRKPFSFGTLANPALIASLTVLLAAGLGLLLWNPWQQQGISSGKTLLLSCAAGMSKPVREIAAAYQEAYGVTVQADFGGSGELLAALKERSQGDLFLTAEADLMRKACREGLVAEVLPVVDIRPALVVRKSTQDRLRKEGKPVTGLRDLLRPDLRFVMANPKAAAIGTLTRQVLERPDVNLWAEIERQLKSSQARISTVGTVNKVADVIATSDDYLGVIWDALARQRPDLEVVPVPEFKGVGEQVLLGVLTRSQQPTVALQFARYLTARDRGLPIFARHHFTPIKDADIWEERPRLHLAAGAMLKPGIEEVVRQFSAREGVTIDTSYAGCGLLVDQMQAIRSGNNPARFPDAYFACDVEFLDKVQQWFEAAITVSKNKIVLAIPKGNPKKVVDLHDLSRKDLQIGLGHPRNSALGKLTKSFLEQLGMAGTLYEASTDAKVVFTDAGHDLINKLRAGALDVAVVYRSNARSSEGSRKDLDIIELDVPGALATQPFAIGKDSQHQYLMRRLLRAIVERHTAERFRSIGFDWVYPEKGEG